MARPGSSALMVLLVAVPLTAASEDPWPRTFEEGEVTFTVHQPQVRRWENDEVVYRAAIEARKVGSEDAAYGVITVTARTDVDKERRLVHLGEIRIVKLSFPSKTASEQEWRTRLARRLPEAADVSLDRLEAGLAIAAEERKSRKVKVKNDPPAILFRQHPAVLVYVDGEPAMRKIAGTTLERVVNTRPLLVKDAGTRRWYLRILDGWTEAPALGGPWAVSAAPPPVLDDALAAAQKAGNVDLLEVPPVEGQERPSLVLGAPEVVVSTRPAELVVTDGPPRLEPIEGTRLVYWKNTSSDVFVDTSQGLTYVVLSGRWYRARSTAGPWTFAGKDALPGDFAKIPPGHDKADVLASIPGTPEASEAVIANHVPQTATVSRSEARLEPIYDGSPELARIEGTQLEYVVNGSVPVIRVSGASWYAVSDGVWFVASGPYGPWAVATTVPPVVYGIPVSSPLHYVTYVRVYWYDDDWVRVGYTPGYLGSYVSSDGVVVFGTGWIYSPWIGSVWYGSPVTWGFGVHVGWSPWFGWGLSFGYAWQPPGCRWAWGVPPWWGPSRWGRPWIHPPPWRKQWGEPHRALPAPVSTVNIYGQWGARVARPAPPRRPVSAPGPIVTPLPPGPARAVAPAPARSTSPVRPAPVQPPPNIFAGPGDRVYRPAPSGGWEQRGSSRWSPATPSSSNTLDRERAARELGNWRARQAPSTPRPPGFQVPPRSAAAPRPVAPPSHSVRPAPARPAAPAR